jgi:formylglycine-generating enzyme required for sulfatase activity
VHSGSQSILPLLGPLANRAGIDANQFSRAVSEMTAKPENQYAYQETAAQTTARPTADRTSLRSDRQPILLAFLLDAQGPSAGSSRVARGGGFNNTPVNLRCANRDNDEPSNRNYNNGFRVVCER